MAIRHEVRGPILWMVVDGAYDDAELASAWERAFADPAFRAGMPALIDSRKTVAAPSRARVAERAEFLTGLRPRLGTRCAILVSDPLHYGLGRMLAAFTDRSGLEVQVFDDAARAEAWLLSRA